MDLDLYVGFLGNKVILMNYDKKENMCRHWGAG
jgi:hypothetical protein